VLFHNRGIEAVAGHRQGLSGSESPARNLPPTYQPLAKLGIPAFYSESRKLSSFSFIVSTPANRA
jgi:hypothetical protein